MNPDKFLSDLSQIYPAERFLTQPAQLTPYESDALTAYRVRPLAVVLPVTQNEVIETVRLCGRYQIPFVARGSGTSLSGGSLPVEGGIVIALNRLDRILRIDPENRIAVVEAGVVNLDVSAAAQPYGLYYAPDPSSQPICTIGGNLAFNSGGAHCLKYGMTSSHVLGIKAVLPDGEVVQLGDESLEGIGPDLVGLFVGSEGLFGIALEVILRLMPKPEIFKTVLASYSSLEGAGNAVSQVVASGLLPGAMEMMDELAIQAAEAAVQANYPPGATALLIVEIDGEKNQVEEEFEQLLKEGGMTLDDLRNQIGEQLAINRLLNETVFSKIEVSESKIKGYYEDNEDYFEVEVEVNKKDIIKVVNELRVLYKITFSDFFL